MGHLMGMSKGIQRSQSAFRNIERVSHLAALAKHSPTPEKTSWSLIKLVDLYTSAGVRTRTCIVEIPKTVDVVVELLI